MTRRTRTVREDHHRAAVRAAVRAALKDGATRHAMTAALSAAEQAWERYAVTVDEPLLQLAAGHYERASRYQLAEAIRDMNAELQRRNASPNGAAAR